MNLQLWMTVQKNSNNLPLTGKQNAGRRKSRWLWVAAALYTLLLVPLVLLLSFTLSSNSQQRVLEQDASVVSRTLSRHAGEVQSLMQAIASMHNTNGHVRSDALLSFAEQLRKTNPMISAIGRYKHLPAADREEFEARMREQGLFGFRLHDLQEDGSLELSPTRQMSLPLWRIDPMHPSLLRLLGSDLAANTELKHELNESTRLNRDALIRVPDNWPTAGSLMVFRPVYRGMHPLQNQNDRISRADGGYLAIVNTELFSEVMSNEVAKYSVELNLHNALGVTSVMQRASSIDNGLLLTSWLKPASEKRMITIGSATLYLTLTAETGILPGYLLAALVVLLLTALGVTLMIMYTSYMQSIRRAREADRDALLAEREKASRTLNAIGDAVVSIDSDARIIHVNPAASRLLDATPEALAGNPLSGFLKLQTVKTPVQSFDPAASLSKLLADARMDIDLTPVSVDNSGSSENENQVLRTTLTREGNQTTGILVFRDNSAEAKLHKALEHQANHDALTGCYNRFYFESQIEKLADGTRNSNQNHALLYMDLDQFKVINDTAGHNAGDRLLVELSNGLNKIVRREDKLSRIGGDEFALLINNVDPETAKTVANTVYEFFQNIVFTEAEHVFQVRASLGLVHFEEVGDDLSEILAAADLACYAAKDLGRNKLFIYSAEDETIATRSSELNWLQRLKQALEEDFFELRMQPLATIETMNIHHFEFLLRLVDNDGIETSPWRIIDAAERYGMMTEVDRWVIDHAFSIVASLDRIKYANTIFAINLSGQSAADPTLIDYIKEKFNQHGIDPCVICFEVTETAAIANFKTAVEFANGVRKLGCLMALDDFGSGLSSFGYLKSLPLDILKIDGQFIRDIATNPVDRAMVKAIFDVATSMNLGTIAEFVEDEKALAVLSEIGVDIAQGYYIGKPVRVDEALLHADEFNAPDSVNLRATG